MNDFLVRRIASTCILLPKLYLRVWSYPRLNAVIVHYSMFGSLRTFFNVCGLLMNDVRVVAAILCCLLKHCGRNVLMLRRCEICEKSLIFCCVFW